MGTAAMKSAEGAKQEWIPGLLEGQMQASSNLPPNLIRSVDAAAESYYRVPSIHLVGVAGVPRRQDVEAVVQHHKARLAAGDASQVEACLQLFAERLGIKLPGKHALSLDIASMAEWPSDLFKQAFVRLWGSWERPALPLVADFRRVIADDLYERQERLAKAQTLLYKLNHICGRA
jgi:hypothetical protein